MKDLEKTKKNLLRAENVVATVLFFSMIATSLWTMEKLPWLGMLMSALNGAFMYRHGMSMYHAGAADAWRKAVDIQLECRNGQRYKAVFWTYWRKNDAGPDTAYRNHYYNLVCKLAGINQHWSENEEPDIAEKDDLYDLYPHKDDPIECVLDARTITTETVEQLHDLHNHLCNGRNGIIHCCMELQPMEEKNEE